MALKSCCCGCASLKGGTTLIGFISIALYVLILALFGIVGYDRAASLIENDDELGLEEEHHEKEAATTITTPVVGLLISILLVIGSEKGIRWLLVPWVMFTMLEIVGGVLVTFMCFVVLVKFFSSFTVFMTLFFGGYTALKIYATMVVIYLFKELRVDNTERVTYRDGQVFSGPNQNCPATNPYYSAPNPGYPVPNPGYAAPIPGYPVSNPGYPVPNPGYPVPNPGYPMQNPGYPVQNPGNFV